MTDAAAFASTIPARRRRARELLLRIAVSIGVLVLTVLIWQAVADGVILFGRVIIGDQPHYILPNPAEVMNALVRDWPILAPALLVTLRLTFAALALAVVGGVLLAVLISHSRWTELAVYPYAVILQVTPIVAIAPLLLVWVPETQVALLILAFIVAFFPILTNTAQGLKSVDHNLANLFQLYGAGRWRTLWHLKTPSALPYFLTGLRIAGGLALIAAVVAEFAAGSSGQGSGLAFRLIEAQFRLNVPRVFAALILLSIAGVAIFFLTSLVSYWAVRHWHESAVPREN